MKIFKNILFILMTILNIPLALMMTGGIIWYTIPTFALTGLGIKISSIISSTAIFWVTISSAILFLTFSILLKIFNKSWKSKIKNFFIKLNSILMALIAIVISVYTFIVLEIEVTTFEITTTRKIGIGVSFVLLFLSFVLSGKISKIINRRIQSYQNAKELNVVGRSSIIYINFLKLVEILFPEILVLILICFCLSWNVATYFIVTLVASFIPMIANIICDLNIRAEVKRQKEFEHWKLVKDVTNNINKGE